MKTTNHRADKNVNQPKWLAIFRIFLGLTLFWKGITFIQDAPLLASYLQSAGIDFVDARLQTIAFIITYANLLGGLFILTGLFTRWASIVQIPILVGAVAFVHVKDGVNFSNGDLVLSVVILALLILFAIKGSGVVSMDEYFRNYYKAGYESGHTKEILE